MVASHRQQLIVPLFSPLSTDTPGGAGRASRIGFSSNKALQSPLHSYHAPLISGGSLSSYVDSASPAHPVMHPTVSGYAAISSGYSISVCLTSLSTAIAFISTNCAHLLTSIDPNVMMSREPSSPAAELLGAGDQHSLDRNSFLQS